MFIFGFLFGNKQTAGGGSPPSANIRVTSGSDNRVTSSGDTRVTV